MRIDIPSKAWALVRDTTDMAKVYPEAVREIRRNYRATITYPEGVTIHADVDEDTAAMLRAYVILCRNRLIKEQRIGAARYEQLVALEHAQDALDRVLCGQSDAS